MNKLIKNIFAAGAFIMFVASPVLAVASPAVSTTAAACDGRVLGIPPWYRGLTEGADCTIKSPDPNDLGAFIWAIVLNVIEMALVITAYIAALFILYGGFLFLTGGSVPGQLEKARKSILNAVIGLVIALGAIGITNLIFTIIN